MKYYMHGMFLLFVGVELLLRYDLVNSRIGQDFSISLWDLQR